MNEKDTLLWKLNKSREMYPIIPSEWNDDSTIEELTYTYNKIRYQLDLYEEFKKNKIALLSVYVVTQSYYTSTKQYEKANLTKLRLEECVAIMDITSFRNHCNFVDLSEIKNIVYILENGYTGNENISKYVKNMLDGLMLVIEMLEKYTKKK